jgi:hypothetical protein
MFKSNQPKGKIRRLNGCKCMKFKVIQREVKEKDFSWQTRNSYVTNTNGRITHLNLNKKR